MAEAPRIRTVAVIGASNDRSKYGNRAVRAYRAGGFEVYPVNPHEAQVEGLRAYASILDVPAAIDRATVYLPPAVTLGVLEEIARKGVRELFLNPGSEDSAVIDRAQALGMVPILACSIVDIGRSPSRPD
jgi:acyl-CoA synthetase (NDP forming)